MTYKSYSSEQTKELGAKLAAAILETGLRKDGATVVALRGDLGAGKTTLVQGFFKGLRLRKIPASPTFILMRRTALTRGNFRNIFHVDAYRAKNSEALGTLGLPEIFKDPRNIVLLEWPERIEEILPKRHAALVFEHGKNSEERKISLRGIKLSV